MLQQSAVRRSRVTIRNHYRPSGPSMATMSIFSDKRRTWKPKGQLRWTTELKLLHAPTLCQGKKDTLDTFENNEFMCKPQAINDHRHHHQHHHHQYHHTSSTAQGGGRSFKNRRPIGEVGCCESGMAERIH